MIGVTGRDITFSHGDQFTVVRGNTYNPGSVQVYVSQSGISAEDEGIYTCRIPDERGRLIDANVGLYLQHSRGEIQILYLLQLCLRLVLASLL